MASINVRVDGLDACIRAVRYDELIRPDLLQGLGEAADEAAKELKRGVPVETGRARNAVKIAVSKAAVPKRAYVRLNVTKRGFRYPWALNTSRKREYHYRSGVNRGKLTRGFVQAARNRASPRMNVILARMASRIASRWQT